jgi:FtsH-binding integral membrane protein
VRQLATDDIRPLGDERTYFAHVFAWMGVALVVTGIIAGLIGRSERAMHVFISSTGSAKLVWIICALLELVLVAGLVGLVQHMDTFEAAAVYLAYAALNGVTISVIFAAFTTKSIFVTFFITGAMFGALALAGYTTGLDLTKWGSFLFMALIGQLIGLVVNLFWLNDTLYWLTTATGVLIFSAYTAYDVQRLKRYEPAPGSDAATVEKSAIVGALALYLDFVNLFLYLLRIFGRRK